MKEHAGAIEKEKGNEDGEHDDGKSMHRERIAGLRVSAPLGANFWRGRGCCGILGTL